MRSLSAKIMVPVAIGLFCTIIGVAISLSNAFKKSATETTIAKAKETIEQYRLLRSYYTTNVVAKVEKTSQIKAVVDHQAENTIPLPATMIHDLSEESQRNDLGVRLKLYSDLPFPNRKDRMLDSFAKAAINYLKKESRRDICE